MGSLSGLHSAGTRALTLTGIVGPPHTRIAYAPPRTIISAKETLSAAGVAERRPMASSSDRTTFLRPLFSGRSSSYLQARWGLRRERADFRSRF